MKGTQHCVVLRGADIQAHKHRKHPQGTPPCTPMCMYTQSHMHPAGVHTLAGVPLPHKEQPGVSASSVSPAQRRAGSCVSSIIPPTGNVLSAPSWGGAAGICEVVSGRSSPTPGPYFTDTPDRACCQDCRPISSPSSRHGSPDKEGHCVSAPPPPGVCYHRDLLGNTAGILGGEDAVPCATNPGRVICSWS